MWGFYHKGFIEYMITGKTKLFSPRDNQMNVKIMYKYFKNV